VSKTHKRLPEEVFNEVFRFILSVAAHKGLLWGKAIGIDSTTIQANASMRSIVRKDSGKGWKDYTKKLAKQAGLEDPTDDELRQFDRTRPGKKVSNDDCENPNDPDATITRMTCPPLNGSISGARILGGRTPGRAIDATWKARAGGSDHPQAA
jgi:transposase